MSEKNWIRFFFIFSIVFLGVNQWLGTGQDINRMPFYCAFGGYAAFFAVYIAARNRSLSVSLPARVSIVLTFLAAVTFYWSNSFWQLYTLLYGIIFTSVIIFVENQLKSRRVSPEIFVNGHAFLLAVSFILTFFQSASAEDTLRYGVGINQACILGLPWIFMLNGWKKHVMFTAALVIAVFSGKRSAIIIFALIPAVYIFYGGIMNPAKRTRNFLSGIGIFILGIVLFFVADNISGGGISERFSAEALEDGSGRGESLKAGLTAIKNMSFSELFLGLDARSMDVAVFNGYLGHNEILEYMLSIGLLGLIIYLSLPITLLWRFWTLHRARSQLAVVYLCCVAALGVLSLISGVFAPIPTSIVWCSFLGWMEGVWRYKKDYAMGNMKTAHAQLTKTFR